MAEISDAELNALTEALNKVASRFGGLDSAIESLRVKIIEGTKDQKDSNESYKRVMRERKKEESEILSAQRRGNLTARETQAALQKLNDRVREVVPPEFKKNFEKTIELEGEINNLRIKNVGIIKAANFATEIFSKGLSHSFKLMGSLSPSVDPLGGALDAATESVRLVGSAFKFVGEHTAAISAFALMLGPEASLAAGALATFTGVAGDAISFLGNSVMPVFNTYVKSLSSGFKDAAQAGGLFVGGLTELQNTAFEAGVNTETFGKLLREQGENLALFGGDVVNGGRRVAQVTRQLQKDLGPDYQQLFVKMGYGVQEIPGIIAKVGADISRTVGGATNEQVAQAVRDYAKNLRVIADLTGKDAKAAQDKADQEFKDLRYRQYLSDLQDKFGAVYRKQFELQAANLPEAELKLLKEKIAVGGNIFTQAAGIIRSTVPAFDQSTDAILANTDAGRMTATSILDTSQAFSSAAAQQLRNSRELAAAGIATQQYSDALVPLQNSYDRVMQNASQTTLEYEKKRDELLTATETTDEKTAELATAEIVGMELKIKAEKAATIALGDYLAGITKINELNIMLIESTGSLIKFIDDSLPGSAAQRQAHRNQLALQSNISQQEQDQEMNRMRSRLGIMQTTPSTINQITTPITVGGRTYASPVGAGNANMNAAEAAEAARNDPRFGGGQAEGGILSGPKSGYLAKLHGTEAVLPENLTALLTDAANSAQTIKEQLPAANVRPDRTEDLLGMLNTKFEDMISLLDDISSHTERTSVRVA